jgi:hypothetical protein
MFCLKAQSQSAQVGALIIGTSAAVGMMTFKGFDFLAKAPYQE